ncbi:MAG: hypothetical protein GXY83_34650 [Rhodopirellula sp.]|nr:hypothetical protein [Rhodopirellula sp.]
MTAAAKREDSCDGYVAALVLTGLIRLNLSGSDFEALALQGTVRAERRGRSLRWKLRFRNGNRQVVRVLRDAQEAAVVERQLAALQGRRKSKRILARAIRAARRTLRASKQTLQPHLAAMGYEFHGLAVRRARGRRPDARGDDGVQQVDPGEGF